MSEHDRLDRIERKLNQIGRSILFGITLLAILAAIVTEPYHSMVFGHGVLVAATFIVVVVVALWWARTPFRD